MKRELMKAVGDNAATDTINGRVVFDCDLLESHVVEFVTTRRVFVSRGGGTIRILAAQAAMFFGLSYSAMLCVLGGNTDRWHTLFDLAGGHRGQGNNNADAHGFGRYLARNYTARRLN